MLVNFADALARVPGLQVSEQHAAQRSAKLLRRRIETGRRPTEDDWSELFPDPAVMRLAQIHLDEGPGTPLFDPEATLTGDDEEKDDEAGAVDQEAWYEFMSDLPDEGLPANDSRSTLVDSWSLGRMIFNVSRGMATVSYDEIPAAEGFRERFLNLARRSDRLDCIEGLPLCA